jgi:hypothetical protein
MPGTPASAPADAQIGRKAKITTLITDRDLGRSVPGSSCQGP